MTSTWQSLLCSTTLVAANTMLTPTDAMFGMQPSRTVNAAFKSNPVVCGCNVLYNLYDLYRQMKTARPREESLKDFVAQRTANWDHRDDSIIKNMASNTIFRNVIALGSVLSTLNVFLLADCSAAVRMLCAAYIAQFALDALVRVYAAKWKLPTNKQAPPGRRPRSNLAVDILCQAALLPPVLGLLSEPLPNAKQLFTTLSFIAGVVDLAYNPGFIGSLAVAASTTASGRLWGGDLFYAGTLGINLGVVCFLLDAFSARKLMMGKEHWIYICGLLAMLAFTFFSGLGSAPVRHTDVGPTVLFPGYGLEPEEEISWWMYLRFYSGYLFPGSGPVANTALCFLFMWLIVSMMTNPSALMPSDR